MRYIIHHISLEYIWKIILLDHEKPVVVETLDYIFHKLIRFFEVIEHRNCGNYFCFCVAKLHLPRFVCKKIIEYFCDAFLPILLDDIFGRLKSDSINPLRLKSAEERGFIRANINDIIPLLK